MKPLQRLFALPAAVAIAVLSFVAVYAQSAPSIVSQPFSLVGNGATVPLNLIAGQGNCTVTLYSLGAGGSVLAQSSSDGYPPNLPQTWSTVTSMNSNAPMTGPGVYAGAIAGAATNFRLSVSGLAAGGTAVGFQTCSTSPVVVGGSAVSQGTTPWVVSGTVSFAPTTIPVVAASTVPISAASSIAVTVAATVSVSVANTPGVVVANTPGVAVANTPAVVVANTASVTVANTPGVAVVNTPGVTVANTPGVAVVNTPTVICAPDCAPPLAGGGTAVATAAAQGVAISGHNGATLDAIRVAPAGTSVAAAAPGVLVVQGPGTTGSIPITAATTIPVAAASSIAVTVATTLPVSLAAIPNPTATMQVNTPAPLATVATYLAPTTLIVCPSTAPAAANSTYIATCDSTGTLNVNSVRGSAGPTQANACDKSVVIAVATATTTMLLPVNGSTTYHVCGYYLTITSGTAPSLQFKYGTSTTCASPTNLSGVQVMSATAGTFYGYGGTLGQLFATAASAGLCILSGGTSPNFNGFLMYTNY